MAAISLTFDYAMNSIKHPFSYPSPTHHVPQQEDHQVQQSGITYQALYDAAQDEFDRLIGAHYSAPKFLFYNQHKNIIEVLDYQPPAAHASEVTVGGVPLTVYHSGQAKEEDVLNALKSCLADNQLRSGMDEATIHSQAGAVATALLEKYNPASTVFVALGQSAKQVSWQLKDKKAAVVNVNASGISELVDPTEPYLQYLKKKISKQLPGKSTVVVVDFANTGASLRRVKADIQGLPGLEKTAVLTVALGVDPDNLPKGIDHVLDTTQHEQLNEALLDQKLKMLMGRSKVSNNYQTWNAADNENPDPSHESYQLKKQLFKQGPQRPASTAVYDEIKRQAGLGD